MKKKVVLLLCAVMLFATMGLYGCGNEEKEAESEYTVLEDVEIPDNAEEGSYGGFTAKYDPDKWVFNNVLNQFAIYDKEGYESGSDSIENINVRVSGDYEGPFTEEDMETLMAQIKEIGTSGFEITHNELMSFNGEPVIYYEAETKLTDEMIDLMIEEGAITEEHIEALGGRETLLNMPPVTQIGINAIIDGKAISITGTYNEEPEHILDAMKLLIKTGSAE